MGVPHRKTAGSEADRDADSQVAACRVGEPRDVCGRSGGGSVLAVNASGAGSSGKQPFNQPLCHYKR